MVIMVVMVIPREGRRLIPLSYLFELRVLCFIHAIVPLLAGYLTLNFIFIIARSYQADIVSELDFDSLPSLVLPADAFCWDSDRKPCALCSMHTYPCEDRHCGTKWEVSKSAVRSVRIHQRRPPVNQLFINSV